MLVLGRKRGEWTEIVHTASGDTIRVCYQDAYRPDGTIAVGRCRIVFDDDQHHFDITRPERRLRTPQPRGRTDEVRDEGR